MEINLVRYVVAYLLRLADTVEFRSAEYNEILMDIHRLMLYESDLPWWMLHQGTCSQTAWLENNHVVHQVAEHSLETYLMLPVFSDGPHRIGRFIHWVKTLRK